MVTTVRYLTLALVMTGCWFDSPFPDVIPPGPEPAPHQPCRAGEAGVALCVDFEDNSLPAQAIDRSPNNIPLTAHDVEPTRREPPGEGAAKMEEESSLRVAESGKLDLPAFTIEMWIQPRQLPAKKEDDAGLFDNYQQYTMRIRGDRKIRCGLGLALGDEERTSSDHAIPATGWAHVACRYANGEMRVYVNGLLDGCETIGATLQLSPLGSAIGAEISPTALVIDGVKDRFIGDIDNVRIHDHAIDETRLCAAAGQTEGCPRACPGSDGEDGRPGR